MKRQVTLIMLLIALFAAACSAAPSDTGKREGESREIAAAEDSNKRQVSAQEATGRGERIQNLILDYFLEKIHFPDSGEESLELETDGGGLPVALINDLKRAVYRGKSDSFLTEINDESLMITARDFEFESDGSDDAEEIEKSLQSGGAGYLIYRCDTDQDGIDEIILVEHLKYEYSHANRAFILKKSGQRYILSGDDYLGYYRLCAIFSYQGQYYIMANYDDCETRTTKAVGLFSLSGDNSGFMWLIRNKGTYIRKSGRGCRYHLLFENENAPLAAQARVYVEEIGTDLIFADRIHNIFYGDETEVSDLTEEEQRKAYELGLWRLYAIDVDNNGEDEFFERRRSNGGQTAEMEIVWYSPHTQSIYPELYSSLNPGSFILTQRWFKGINGKTVIFSLFCKRDGDSYLLDARVLDNDRTVPLVDYMVEMETLVEVSDYWDYEDTNWVPAEYENPDYNKAFPSNLNDLAHSFTGQVQGGFSARDFEDGEIPNDLIVKLERALFDGNVHKAGLGKPCLEISWEELKNKSDTAMEEEYGNRPSHIYQYQLEGEEYHLTVTDSGGSARFVDIEILQLQNGAFHLVDSETSLDLEARAVMYGGELYLIERSYNYYSKYVDTVIVSKLEPEGFKNYVSISLKPEKFQWKKIYGNPSSQEEAIDQYVDSIRDRLMNESPICDNIRIFTGDENADFDHDKYLRLKSVGGDYDYYEIDYDNDGEMEYFTKRFWFPSNYTTLYLINNFYQFTDKRIETLDQKEISSGTGALVQLWFKEIDGKVFTFKLFLTYGYNYALNVSLIERNRISQEQTYLIAPELTFSVENEEMAKRKADADF